MIQSRLSRVLGAMSVVGALVVFSGCNPGVNGESAETAASELAAGPKGERHGKMGRHGPPGPAFLLGAALHELDLTDAQKATIEGEMKALRDAHAEDREDARGARQEALAAAVRSGKVDEAALLAKLRKDAPAPDTARLAKALSTLHATLTAAQRQELVKALGDRMEKHDGPGDKPGRGRHGGDGERGPKGDRGAMAGRGPKGEHGPGRMGPLGHLLHGIDLSDDQQAKVREGFEKMAPPAADREAMKAKHEAFRKSMQERLATFASDSFDASAFVAPPKDGMGPEKMAEHMVKALAIVVPVLDAGQREALAKNIEEGPQHPR
jgi:Spy/CpxP family protein refolding chaperone